MAMTTKRNGWKMSNLQLATHLADVEREMRKRAEENSWVNRITPTFIPELDQALKGGLQCGELAVLAGSPGHGTTAMAMGIARNLGRNHHPALYVSFEMPETALIERICISEFGEDDPDDIPPQQMAAFNGWPLEIASPKGTARTLPGIREAIGRANKHHPNLLVIVDHVELITPEGGVPWDYHMDVVACELKTLAMQLRVPILAVAHTRAAAQRQVSHPTIDDLPGTDNFLGAADVICLLYRSGVDIPSLGAETGLVVRKNVRGWNCIIDFDWDAGRACFEPRQPAKEAGAW